MTPSITATLTVEVRDGIPSLLITLPGGEDKFNIPLDESATAIKRLVRELSGLIVAAAHKQIGKITEALAAMEQ
jgi:hypothetical protein